MNPLLRWTKFNVVGLAGMMVQLLLLAGLNRSFRSHYLLVSALAVEITLLHNFAWHVRFTWRDRRYFSFPWKQLLRFQLSNGTVSLTGNVALMRLFVKTAHLPMLIANFLCIACCSMANFFLSECWAFSSSGIDGMAEKNDVS